ncbi:putative AAA+ superfamily ATPase [Clostridiales Family XIII bacterium PM5-7]
MKNKENLFTLNLRLNALSVFRSILETPVVSSLQKLLFAIENGPLADQLFCYGAFSKAIYDQGGDLSSFVKEFVLNDENQYLNAISANEPISNPVYECLNEELSVLQLVADVATPQIATLINYDKILPRWDTHFVDLKQEYMDMIDALPKRGYGIFAKYRAFKVVSGQLVPIQSPDMQSLNSLYGYQRERNQVLENTRALVQGQPASNVLLYGDAGTGKSSTIKACANAFFEEGVRLVEFNKSQLSEIPVIIEALHNNPLRFIFYIDDLSFGQNDDAFCNLKGILEGNVTSYTKNIVIYATSNRRHLIKESMESRLGNDLHLNDTLQETMSLSARFGLTITFSKPEKDLYLEIVMSLAKEYGIRTETQEEEAALLRKAEAFAIRSNGRSPRTAKQFIQLVSAGIK